MGVITYCENGHRGVYLCGHSAGAQIAAMMLTVDWTQDDPAFQHLIKGQL